MSEGLPLMQLVQLPRDPAACWTWIGNCGAAGYPIKTVAGKCLTGRQWMWQQLFGPVPAGLVVSTTCGNRGCVNPHHLRLCTMAEAVQAGNGATLTVDDVRELRALVNNGVPWDLVAARYGISKTTISDVMRRKSWRVRSQHKPGGRPAQPRQEQHP